MRRIVWWLCAVIFTINVSYAQNEVVYSLHFAGNGVHVSRLDTALYFINNSLDKIENPTGLILLGDNFALDKSGENIENLSSTALVKLKNIQEKTDLFIIPGESEWDSNGNKGKQSVNTIGTLLDSVLQRKNPVFLSEKGCPGPIEVNVNQHITLAVFDSQWILHPWDKPGQEDACSTRGVDEILVGLTDIIERNYDRIVVVAMHHPLITEGAFYNTLIPGNQYLIHPIYKAYSTYFLNALSSYNNVMVMSSHDQYQAIYKQGNTPFLLTSMKSTKKRINKGKLETEIVHKSKKPGFGRLDFHKSGEVSAVFWEVNEAGVISESYNNNIIKLSYTQQEEIVNYHIPDSLKNGKVLAASTQYQNMNRWWFGENYRSSWATPTQFPVFDIGKEKGGMTIKKRGGGQQTRSLRLQAKDGHQYVLRSIEKYAVNAVPEDLRKTVAAELVQDQISASHPYAAYIIPKLADNAEIYHTNPQPVYLPNDPRLRQYNNDFGSGVFLYEERPAGNWKGSGKFGNSKKIISTFDMIEKLQKDNDNYVDQRWVLKSRLFDMMIGDWDRHDDQWRWASFKDKKRTYYRPIPRDRDQAFFINDGTVMRFVGKKWAMPKFQGYGMKYKHINEFNFNGRYFDRDFINEPSKEEWIAIAKTLQNKVTDQVIDSALMDLPSAIQQNDAAVLKEKIKSNRDHLTEYAKQYYAFLAKNVTVEGSNKHEFFEVERLKNGDSHVRVYKKSKKKQKGRLLYDRVFHLKETKEIRLFGLNGKDQFLIKGKAKKGIKIRAIGGEGKDI